MADVTSFEIIMAVSVESYKSIIAELKEKNVTLVAVSKTKSVEEILELYQLGQRDFGENYVQELLEKYPRLPQDIRWHFIGHLQSNKVKLIAPFVSLIHSVDSLKLLKEINKQAKSNNRKIDCLLQVYIAREETKFGLDEKEVKEIMKVIAEKGNEERNTHISGTNYTNICVKGLMGMASFTDDLQIVRVEFHFLKSLFDRFSNCGWSILSMGMSSDYRIAVEEGSNMVRIGSLLFGKREKKG
jgi:pyridoxal phosphate enzyme (YggS family)